MSSPSSFKPFFSVIILYWNNGDYLIKCLDHLNVQTFDNFEVILVNNGSPKALQDGILGSNSNLKISYFELPVNIGFAAANNYAANHSQGDYLVLLNGDAFPKPEWLQEMHTAAQQYPGCFFASKLIMANQPTRLDGEGDVYHFSGLAWRKSYLRLVETVVNSEPVPVFSACGAAAIYPKDDFLEVGGFDEDYFSYLEDVDLGFRLRLIGLNCIYIPDAIVYHVGSASTSKRSDFAVYHGQRNIVWTFIKDMPGILFWLLLPIHISINLLGMVTAIFRKEAHVVCKAKLDAIRDISNILEKRKHVQATRRIPITGLIKYLDWNPISPLTKRIAKQ